MVWILRVKSIDGAPRPNRVLMVAARKTMGLPISVAIDIHRHAWIALGMIDTQGDVLISAFMQCNAIGQQQFWQVQFFPLLFASTTRAFRIARRFFSVLAFLAQCVINPYPS